MLTIFFIISFVFLYGHSPPQIDKEEAPILSESVINKKTWRGLVEQGCSFKISLQYQRYYKHQNMKFTIQTILSLPVDGASSHMITFNNTIRILLDCGIGPTFDLTKYRQRANQLKSVCLVLISHSRLQYSGALCFLIDQLGLNPKIFYTTQPIMRCSPLNLHEGLLCLHFGNYNKKVFNRIYKIYESINIIKTQQKKSVEIQQTVPTNQKALVEKSNAIDEQVQPTIGEVEKIIYFTSYSAGSSMGNLAWRVSFGLVNILYLVEYNNYSLYHIGGLELAQIRQPTDILITDVCPDIPDQSMNKNRLYTLVKDAILSFYEKNKLPAERPPPITNQESQNRLVLCCEPGQVMIEVMALVKKVMQELQPVQCREKIRVIHLSSRYLQLIKSQIDYFSPYFKETLENIEQFYIHSKTICGRINIATYSTLQTLINDQLSKSVHLVHIGNFPNFLHSFQQQGSQNIASLNLFLPDEKLMHSASKIEEQRKKQRDQEMQEGQKVKDDRSELQQETEMRDTEKQDLLDPEEDPQEQFQPRQPLHGKYFSQIGFPQFLRKPREQDHDFDEYGIRHQYDRFAQRQTIDEYRQNNDQNGNNQNEVNQKKNATIEVMNIQFKIPDSDKYVKLDASRFQKKIEFCIERTNFNSSIQIILALKPANVVFINTKSTIRSADQMVGKYKNLLTKHTKDIINLYELAPKNYCHLAIYNQLISYKVNYIPIPADRKVQKVKGVINYSHNGLLCIHLECLEQKELLDFRLDLFYRKLKTQKNVNCTFTKQGIIVQGICISREGKNIILQGNYSESYFKVRRLLYDFLQIQ